MGNAQTNNQKGEHKRKKKKTKKKSHSISKISRRANSYVVPIEIVTKLMVVSKYYACSEKENCESWV